MLNNEQYDAQRITPNIEEAKQYLSNSFLDRITKTNVYAYYAIYTILIIVLICHGLSHVAWYGFICALIIGALIWSFVEYGIHRFLFHWESSHPGIKLLTFMFHGV